MINWIDINLPWGAEVESFPFDYPDLSKKEKEAFGKTLEESKPDFEAYNEISELIDIELRKLDLTYEEYKIKEIELWERWKYDPVVISVNEYHDFKNKIYEWSDKQPEVIEYEKNREKYYYEQGKNSFSGQWLNKPGMLIELEDGTKHLIGTINVLRGVCDDCTGFGFNTIVKRYALVFDMESVK